MNIKSYLAHSKSISKDHVENFYDERYRLGYMEEWDSIKKQRIIEIFKMLNLPSNISFLDYGCGNGVFIDVLSQNFPSWNFSGTDVSNECIKYASSKYKNHSFFRQGIINHRTYDVLFSHHVLEHVLNIDESLNEISDYTKVNGLSIHVLPCGNRGSFEHSICSSKKNGIEISHGNRFFYEDEGHLRRLKSNELINKFKKVGFELEMELYANHYYEAISWMSDRDLGYINELFDIKNAINSKSKKFLNRSKSKVLRVKNAKQYLLYYNEKRISKLALHKKIKVLILRIFFKEYLRRFDISVDKEWEIRKFDKRASEMYLIFKKIK